MKLKSIYDNGSKTLDRYTIVTTNRYNKSGHWYYDCISSSESGLGVFMWCECMIGRHLGKKVEMKDLSIELQTMINNALKD